MKGFQKVVLLLDRSTIPTPPFDSGEWMRPIHVDLASHLTPGPHDLQIVVVNWNGHPAVLARSEALALATDDTWEVSHDGREWRRSVCIADLETTPLTIPQPTAAQATLEQSKWMIPCLLLVGLWSVLRERGHLARFACTDRRVRWVLLLAWIALAANNLSKIPPNQGFDIEGHVEYVRFVADHLRLPLPTDGWEMHQAPLCYLLSAGLARLLRLWHGLQVDVWLRLLPLACGAMQVEVAYRILRRSFPDREDLRCIGLWIAGLLPVNLYMSQVVSNEPLAGITTAIVCMLCLGVIQPTPRSSLLHHGFWIGVALGVALLSKATATLWIPLSGIALFWGAAVQGRGFRAGIAPVLVAWSVAAVLAGWFYARSWWHVGSPLLGNWGWQYANGMWWQDPSYRIPQHFTHFGRALVQPVYAAVHSYWDGLYSTMWADGLYSGSSAPPPWRLESMIAGSWLGAPITLAVLLAMTSSPLRGKCSHGSVRFASLAVGFYVAAALYMYLRVPIYGVAKASYMLGLVPCFALLAAAGMRPLLATRWSRALVNGFLVCFGVAAFRAYLVT